MFSEYTVKKMIPRIVIAIILVNLSWPLCQAAISMTNTLGDGIGDLIRSGITPDATKSDYTTFDDLSWAGLIGAGSAAIGAGVLGIAALFSGGVFAAVGAILAAVAALFFGFLALMFRRFFIATLVLLAPLALVCWAIPGMEKWAKRWWDLFIKLLLMFPFIMAMFAVSDVLSVVLGDVAGNFLAQLMLVFIRFAPFALIPLTFKIAGGAFGTITGMVNDRGKGLFDKGKSWGRERSQTTKNALKKKERKGMREQSKHLAAAHDVYGQLSDTSGGSVRRKLRGLQNRGISEQVTRAAKAKHSQEDLSQAQYALEANGLGGIDYKMPDGSRPEFEVTYVDKNGKTQTEYLKKDDALKKAVLGATVKDQHTGEVLSDGSMGARRAAAMYATKQGLAPVASDVQDELAQRQLALNARAAKGENEKNSPEYAALLKTAREGSGVFQEAMQTNVGSMMPKMPSYFKGANQAFGRVEGSSFQSYDPTEVTKMIDWLGDQGNFTDSSGAYDAGAHATAVARAGQAVQRVVSDPSKFTTSPETLRQFRQDIAKLDPAKVPVSALSSDMLAAIGKIDKDTGVIR